MINAPPSNRPKRLSGTPPKNNKAKPLTRIMTVEPKSGSINNKPPITPSTTKGITKGS